MANTAYEYAIDLLSARAYTARNLRRKLVQKEFDSGDIELAMERLVASRLVDDARYAAEFARQKLIVGGSSVRRVKQDLMRRGLSSENIRAAIELVEEEEDVDMTKSIDAAAKKKLASMGGVERDVARKRLFGFLARRGFELADIRSAVERALAEDDN